MCEWVPGKKQKGSSQFCYLERPGHFFLGLKRLLFFLGKKKEKQTLTGPLDFIKTRLQDSSKSAG